MHSVHIYTDGSALGNPGPGGYGIVMEWVGKNYQKEWAKGFRYTTNNRMELLAVNDALRLLKKPGMKVKVFSDSKYVVEAVEKKWVFGWAKKNFKDKKNPDLWRDFLTLYAHHEISFQWIKGHNDHAQNERCDALAVKAAKEMPIHVDTYYEAQTQKK